MSTRGPSGRWLDVTMLAAAACCALLYARLLSVTWAPDPVVRGVAAVFVPLAWTPLVVVAYRATDRLYRATCRRAILQWNERVRWDDGGRGEAHFAVHEERSWWGTGAALLVGTGLAGLVAPGVVFDLVALFHIAAVFLMPVLRPSRRFGRFTVAPGGVTLQWLDGKVVGTSWGRVGDVVISSPGGLRMRGEGRELLGSHDLIVEVAEIPRLRDTIAAYWPPTPDPKEIAT